MTRLLQEGVKQARVHRSRYRYKTFEPFGDALGSEAFVVCKNLNKVSQYRSPVKIHGVALACHGGSCNPNVAETSDLIDDTIKLAEASVRYSPVLWFGSFALNHRHKMAKAVKKPAQVEPRESYASYFA